MKRLYEGQTFERLFFEEPYVTFRDAEFVECTFRFCAFSDREKPLYRALVQRMTFRNCTYVEAGGIDSAMVEDVLVDNLKIHGLLQAWAMVFKHVTLRGRIGCVKILNQQAPTGNLTSAMMRAWEEANAEYYRTVDWALDLSRAEFVDCDIRGIPARLIRRDPETQAVVTRQAALRGEWKKLDLERTHWQIAIEWMLASEDSDVVLVAPKRARNFKNLLDGIKLLREAGVAEPD